MLEAPCPACGSTLRLMKEQVVQVTPLWKDDDTGVWVFDASDAEPIETTGMKVVCGGWIEPSGQPCTTEFETDSVKVMDYGIFDLGVALTRAAQAECPLCKQTGGSHLETCEFHGIDFNKVTS